MLMGEVVKVLMANSTDEETWSYEARDILLDTWTTLLAVSMVKIYFITAASIYNIMHHCVYETLCHIWLSGGTLGIFFVIVRVFIKTNYCLCQQVFIV